VLIKAYDAAAASHGGPDSVTLLMHCFSNTGWLGYCGLVGDLEAARPAALAAMRGVVIDSAPFPAMSPEVWAAGFMTALGSSKKKRRQQQQQQQAGPADAPDQTSASFKAVAAFFRVWMQGARKRALKAVIADEARLVAWPALFIFCEDDHVIPASSVRAAAAAHAVCGGGRWAARTLAFASSEHVGHLRHHRSAYLAALDAFVARDVLGKGVGEGVAADAMAAAVAAPACPRPLPPIARSASRTLSRSLSMKLDPSTLGALTRSTSIKAGHVGLGPIFVRGGGGGGGGGLARAASIRAAGGRSGATTPTAAVVASLRASLPQLM
jgi:hypothetical protein